MIFESVFERLKSCASVERTMVSFVRPIQELLDIACRELNDLCDVNFGPPGLRKIYFFLENRVWVKLKLYP